MPFVIVSKSITQKTLKDNPDKVFIFGDNYERVGNGGQAAACRGMKNTIGLATKHNPGDGYFEEIPYDIAKFCLEVNRVQEEAEDVLKQGRTVVWLEGIGMGLANLGSKPIYVFLINQLKETLRNYKP